MSQFEIEHYRRLAHRERRIATVQMFRRLFRRFSKKHPSGEIHVALH